MTTLQKSWIAAATIASLALGITQARRASQLRIENKTLLQRQIPLAEQIHKLELERDQTALRLTALANAIQNVKTNSTELLKLRGEITRLRSDSNELAQMKSDLNKAADDPEEIEMKTWLARVKQLKLFLDERPKMKIPELKLLTDKSWLSAAREVAKKQKADPETDFLAAAAEVRHSGECAFAALAMEALKKYAQANMGGFPTDALQLKPYFQPAVEDAILQRYIVAPAEKFGRKEKEQDWVLTQKELVDKEQDHHISITSSGYGYSQSLAEQYPPEILAIKRTLNPILKDYSAANNGLEPNDPSQLLPYAKTSEQQSAIQKILEMRKSDGKKP